MTWDDRERELERKRGVRLQRRTPSFRLPEESVRKVLCVTEDMNLGRVLEVRITCKEIDVIFVDGYSWHFAFDGERKFELPLGDDEASD